MTKEKRMSTIHKLRIGLRLSMDEIEETLSVSSKEAMMAGSAKAGAIELARIDMMGDETLLFFRGDRSVTNGFKTILKNKFPKAKFRVSTTTTAALAKAP